jgi:tetratricopeptide (TPR) repeat protein
MTREQVAFIGREAELEQIRELISEWGTRRVLCIHAGGGIGKTRLLQEVRTQWRKGTASPALTEVLAFDDRAFHVPETLRYRLAEMLGLSGFNLYLRQLVDYQKMTRADLSKERLGQERQTVLKAFRDCLCEALSGRRGVILLDTTDALEEGGSTWDYIVSDLALQPCNAAFLIAGRNVRTLYEQLRSQIGEDAQLLELLPLGIEASKEYLLARQTQLYSTIDPEIAQKVVLLAQGRPILIDLAVDWLGHKIPLPWLEEESLEEIQGLPPTTMKARRREFEHNLVYHVMELRTDLDRLFLALTHVYPLNAPLAAELLGLNEEKAADVLESARSYISIKQLHEGWITLHDEVRRLLSEVEAKVDPEGKRKWSDNLRAASYFETAVRDLREKIKALAGKEQAARAAGRAQEEFDAGIKRGALEREYWMAAGQLLHHKLRVMPTEGVDIFIHVFDEATRAYHFSVREGFIEQVRRVFDRLASSQQYEFNIRRARHLFDETDYVAAREVLLELFKDTDLLPYQQIEVVVQLGNVEIRLGNLRTGSEYFERAVDICQEHGMTQEIIRAENALGWAYRLMGNLAKAAEYYNSALRRSLGSEDMHQRALILNNLGFVLGLQPVEEEEGALPLCRQALEIWRELEDERGIAQVFCTIGEILRFHNRSKESLEYFDKSAEIFERANDLEWQSAVYCGRGIARFLLGNLERAQSDLEKARKIGLRRDEPRYLHYLAHVALAQGDIQEATGLFKQSYDVSQVNHDLYFEINSLGDLAAIAALEHEFYRRPEFEERCERYRREYPGTLNRDVGLLIGYLGDLALGEGDTDGAIRYYQEGFSLLAGSGGYGPYTLEGHLERTGKRWKDWVSRDIVSVDSIHEIGERLEQFWVEEGLVATHIQALLFFTRWKEWGKEAK